MRPANHATDPYVISPSGLAIDLDTYGHVRLRIRKTGAPTWEGYLWWKLTGDSTWDAARRITIAEPAFDSGISVVAVDLDITGELGQIRIDLSSEQDGTDYFEIDWVAVGRPSPGASVASVNTINTALSNAINSEASAREALAVNLTGVTDPAGLVLGDLASGLIYSERTARVAADSSMQSDIITLSGSLAAAEGNITATADAVSALDIRVEATEDGVSTLSSDLTALTGTVAGKADTSALDELATEINIGNLEGLSAQATGIRSLESSLLADALETVELGTGAYLANQQTNSALAAVRQETYTRTDQNEAATTAVAGRVDVLEATLPGKADASYVSSVEARVADTETGLTAAVEAIDLQEVEIGTKADATALATTNTAVSTLDGEVTSLASQVSSVEAKADDATASGLVKFEAVAAPAGVTSRFAVMLRQTVGAAYKTAGFYLDLRMVEGELVSEFAVLSDRFVVTDGANNSYPLVFEGGVLKTQNLKVGWGDIEGVAIGTAQIANAAITSAKIGYLEVNESNISLGSITARYLLTGEITNANSASWTTVATVTIDNPSESFVLLHWSLTQSGARASGTGSTSLQTRFRRVTGNVTIGSIFGTIGGSGGGSVAASGSAFEIDDAPAGNVTYAIEYLASGSPTNSPAKTVSGTVKFMWGKR